MAVDEQIARAWGRLQTDGPWVPIDVSRHQPLYSVWKLAKPDSRCAEFPAGEHGTDCSHIGVPDPATQPWEWFVAAIRSGLRWSLSWEFQTKQWLLRDAAEDENYWGDTPEAALEAAIRIAWKTAHAQ